MCHQDVKCENAKRMEKLVKLAERQENRRIFQPCDDEEEAENRNKQKCGRGIKEERKQ